MKFTKIVIAYMTKYLLAFLLIFITSVAVFRTAKSSIEQYILERTQIQIQEGVQTVKESVDLLEIIGQMMYQSTGFTSLTLQEKGLSTRSSLQLRNSNDLLKQMGNVIDSPYVFVLFRKNDLYLSSIQCGLSFTGYYGNSLFIRLPDMEITDASQLKNYLFESHKNGQDFLRLESLTCTTFSDEEEFEDVLLYLTDGILTHQSSSHIFCFLLSEEYLVQTILPTELKEDSFLYIQDTVSGDVLLSYGEIPEIIKTTAIGEEPDEIPGYHTTATLQKKLGWRIVTGYPDSFIDEQMAPVQRLLIIYLLLGLAAVLILTLYFSLTRYYGFQKVLLAIPEDEVDVQKEFNDYKLLAHNVARLDKQKETYRIQADELRQKNRAILLENLITRGEGTDQECQFFEEYFGKEPEFYSLAMVRFLQPHFTEDSSTATFDIIDFLMQKNIVLRANVHSGIADELFLIELPSVQEENLIRLLQIFEEMAEMVSAKYNCILHIGISTVGTGISNISKCYEQTKLIVQSQYLYESENIVQLYGVTANFPQENPITIDFLTRLYTMLICGRYTDVKKELNQIAECYARMPYLYETHREQIFYSLKNIYYTAMLNLNCSSWEKHLPVYVSSAPCAEMISAFQESAAWICDYILQGKKSKNENLKERILEIIHQNYQNPDLSALLVSEEVGISEKYLYQFWKEQTGETFFAYLLRVRIDKAREYLEQTDYSNKEIAALTGFASANTFYRNFQKLMGVSPKYYKDKMDGKLHQ